ncbi:MAG TPA: hypothetical protein VIF08_04230 [Candidatus Limnocylindrales bacterium]
MRGSWWRDPDYRRDALILVGLFGLGMLINILVGVAMLVLGDLLGPWSAEYLARDT